MCERGTIFQYITVYEEVPYSVKDGIKLNAGKGLDNGKKQGCFYSWEYNYASTSKSTAFLLQGLVPRTMVKLHPRLSQILSTVFSSKNM